MDHDLLVEDGVVSWSGEVELGDLVPPEAMSFLRLRTLFTAPPTPHVYSCSESMELLRILHVRPSVRPNQSHLYSVLACSFPLLQVCNDGRFWGTLSSIEELDELELLAARAAPGLLAVTPQAFRQGEICLARVEGSRWSRAEIKALFNTARSGTIAQ